MPKPTLKEKISALLSKHGLKLAADKVEMKATGKLEDGSEILTPADAFAMDAEVFVMDEGGNAVPAPDGEYVVDGKTKITVSGGKIATAEEIQVEEEEQELSAEAEAAISELAGRVKALEEKSATAEAELKAANEKLAASEKENVELKAKVTQLSKEPVTKSVKTGTKTELKKDDKPEKTWGEMTYAERIANPKANPNYPGVLN